MHSSADPNSAVSRGSLLSLDQGGEELPPVTWRPEHGLWAAKPGSFCSNADARTHLGGLTKATGWPVRPPGWELAEPGLPVGLSAEGSEIWA